MITHTILTKIVFLNGIYNVICGFMFTIPSQYRIPILNNIHKHMIKCRNVESNKCIMYMGYWIITYGVMRMYDIKIAGYSYLIECVCFVNEIYNNRVYFYKGVFVCLTSFYLFLSCMFDSIG